MKSLNVLIIEDTLSVSNIIQKTLESYGYNVATSTSAEEAAPIIRTSPIDIIIMSTRLARTDSCGLCRFLRENHPTIFIIGINHKGEWEDKIQMLQNGADDCMNFPFPTQELLVRIQALLRRPHISEGTNIKYGKIELNPSLMQANYRSQPLTLTKREYKLLEYLLRNKERTVTREELLDHVWDYRRSLGSNTIDVHIQKIRGKMKKKFRSRRADELRDIQTEIRTIHGIGYRLDNSEYARRNRINSKAEIFERVLEKPL